MSKVRIFIDCSNIIKNNYLNGVSRVVKNISNSLLRRETSAEVETYLSQIQNDIFYYFCLKNLFLYNFNPWHRNFRNRYARFILKIFDQIFQKIQFFNVFGIKKKLFKVKSFNNAVVILADSLWSIKFTLALNIFKERGGKIIFYIHDVIPLYPIFDNRHITDIKFKEWIDWGILNADVLLCVSKDSERMLIKYAAFSNAQALKITERTRVLLSGYNYDELKYNIKIRQDLMSLIETSNTHIFLVVGSADSRKNLRYIYNSFQMLWMQGINVMLVFAGPFSIKDQFIEDLKNSEFINDRLFIFSNLDDFELNFLYKSASCLVFASRYEGFGLPIVEAMTRGLPIICSDIPIFRELADGYARFVDISQEDGLSDSLIEFLKETPVEQRLSRSPRPWRSWDDYADELLAICRELVGGDIAVSSHKD